MASEHSVAPSRARLQRAWRAGLRPRSPWLVTGGAWLVIAFGITPPSASPFEPWTERMRDGLAAAEIDRALLLGTVDAALTWSATAMASLVAAMLLAMLLSGSLGPIDRDALQGLHVAPRGTAWVLPIFGGVAALFALYLVLVPLLAGAARAPDASRLGLSLLWSTWARRIATATGGVLLVAGLVELVVERERWIRALYQSVDEARRERKRDRSRRQAAR